MGLEAEDLVSDVDGLPERDLLPFFYPHDKDIERVGVRGIYLNNFMRWDTKAQHEKMIRQYGYETAAQTRTFDTYSDVDSLIYSDLHDYLKFLKFGYGKVTDHASREIRLRRMSRSQGIELVNHYAKKPPAKINLFLQWLGINENTLIETVDKFRDPAIWFRNDNGDWQLKDRVDRHSYGGNHRRAKLDLQEDKCQFEISTSRKPAYAEDRYVLIARGHVD